ncbi:MAG: hypothetical protein DLM62_02610 [Pseudonocardiales bacterium]|nr:MAG: hypothetical protein DLM62_02610 [Pseudonocardiales bacterium]
MDFEFPLPPAVDWFADHDRCRADTTPQRHAQNMPSAPDVPARGDRPIVGSTRSPVISDHARSVTFATTRYVAAIINPGDVPTERAPELGSTQVKPR